MAINSNRAVYQIYALLSNYLFDLYSRPNVLRTCQERAGFDTKVGAGYRRKTATSAQRAY